MKNSKYKSFKSKVSKQDRKQGCKFWMQSAESSKRQKERKAGDPDMYQFPQTKVAMTRGP